MDLSDLKEILQILEDRQIAEFELEQDGMKLRVCKAARGNHAAPTGPGLPPASPPPFFVPGATAPPAPAAAPETAAPDSDGTIVKSPIVGTFFRAADPNAAAFVNVGDQVKVGQVLCIIEAMKLMNEIEAEITGEILRIHPENGQPVQYGDSLFTIRPTP
ncbi:MAG TPA: acetyl-CoA carboxylase biotin carboxyl carrier protein [Vicinamibacteria bacterium]|nr:acetyl-CoA carboxylase biotin carboxyl carrier protein [Vicinamibacteria bacterium]